MSTTFDEKVYDIIKSGKNTVSNEVTTIKFNQAYPIGSTVMSNTAEVPIKLGTWKLSGIYGVCYHEWSHPTIFNKDYVLMHLFIDAGGQQDFKMGFNAYFADSTIKALIGQSYTSPKSGQDPNIYYNFYDDKGGWYAVCTDASHMTIHGSGLADTSRRYEVTVLIKINDLVNTAQTFKDEGLTFEFTRTE